MRVVKVGVPLFLLLLTLAISVVSFSHSPDLEPSPAASQDVKITTDNGVTVVLNPKKPGPRPGGPSKLVLKEELVIGEEKVPDGYLFAELRSIGVDDEGHIWTLDWEDIKMRVFDKDGNLVSTFGRKGQGPEEWENPNRMIVTPDGTGVVLDLNKLTFYSRDGRCLKEQSTARAQFFRFKFDSKGNLYGDSLDFGDKMILRLVKFDPDLNPVVTLAEVEEPFTPGAINAFTVLILSHVTEDDRVIWMTNAKYEFHILDPKGKLIRKIVKDYEPRKVTARDRKQILDDRYGNDPYRSQIVFPDEFPSVYYFIGDAAGRLYAQTYDEDGKGGWWYDVFDEEGRCITRFSLPKDEMPFVVKDGKLYAMIQEDEEGRPLVKRYAMEWR